MLDTSIAAALVCSPPPDYASDRARALYDTFQLHLLELSSVSSHATEGDSYARDLQMARELVRDYYQAYQLQLAADLALLSPASDPLLLRRGRSRSTDFSMITLDQL